MHRPFLLVSGRVRPLAGAFVLAALLALVGAGSVDAAVLPAAGPSSAQLRLEALVTRARSLPPPPLASVAGQELLRPRGAVAVGFHESSHPKALPLAPTGTLMGNHNAARVALPPVSGEDGGRYVVLPSRGRPHGPTTAADISMSPERDVTSPVSGTVTDVRRYTLYGSTPDALVEIVPAHRPDLAVRLLHVEGVRVQVGERVRAGRSVVATRARELPFASQIDRFAGGPLPHVHLEVLHRARDAHAQGPARPGR